MNTLQNKVALVTGGSTGIGLASARELAARGAKVFLTGRRPAELEAAVAAVGHGAVGIQADASKLADLDRVYERIRRDADRRARARASGGPIAPRWPPSLPGPGAILRTA